MPLVTVSDLSVGFRGPPLLENVSCQIDAGQRIALLGRNGAGKTTFMRLLSGQLSADHGQVAFAPGIKVALLPQDVPQDLTGTVHEVVAAGLGDDRHDHDVAWKAEERLERILEDMKLPVDVDFTALSAGMKRRVLLARALVAAPDLLLLDEPTNHLDVDSITWLEEALRQTTAALLFVTHDRMFMRRLATRILEIDRGRLFDWSCDYDTFLARKEDLLAAEEKQNALFDKRLAEEEVWIRTGIKARRTRNEGRVRALEAMRLARSQRRGDGGKAQITIQEAERSGTLVAQLKDVSFSYGERDVISDFSTTIFRGDKVGIVGPNGAGKTTLLRLLLERLTPTSGAARLGTNLQVAYFDQLRGQLNGELSVQDNVADGYDNVSVGGRPRHVIGYLSEFLFSAERARTLVKFLSGGECNRVLLAKLFAKPANVIVLDEPTNDLDAETLELLEDRLVQFQGTVLVVSHDRAFLNNVVTSTIAFEDGTLKEYVGGYDDWQRQRAERAREAEAAKAAEAATRAGSRSLTTTQTKAKRRLSYKEQQELAALPAVIERLETQIAELHSEMAETDFYRRPGDQIAQRQTLVQKLDAELATAYRRWEILEPPV